jgi:hypothetical protein
MRHTDTAMNEPTEPTETKRSPFIQVQLTAEDKTAWSAQAKADGFDSVSGWIRWKIRNATPALKAKGGE